mmetsp:Transcript_27240/g.68720  ORF Transcript_27240/g.68720 Transcript_27240/m.68720 type:complete len:1241 (-) Transcript_27240:761-4483(-)
MASPGPTTARNTTAGNSPTSTEGNDFTEVDGREQYYVKKEAEFNAVADLLKPVQKGFRDNKSSMHNSSHTAHAVKGTVAIAQPKLEIKFDKFDKAALFLNEQPKRVLAGGENMRLEIKKLKFEIVNLKDDIGELEKERNGLSEENQYLKQELTAQKLRAEAEMEAIRETMYRAFYFAEYAAENKANMECMGEFWGIWRNQYTQDKVAELLFQIKNQAVTIDKLRKNKRIKTKASLETMKQIQNRILKDKCLEAWKQYTNHEMAEKHVEKMAKKLREKQEKIDEQKKEIKQLKDMVAVLEAAMADNKELLLLQEQLKAEIAALNVQIEEMNADYEELAAEAAAVRAEFEAYRKEIEREKADTTDYKGLSQRFAKLFQREQQERIKFQTKLHILATPEEMQKLIKQDEYEAIVGRLEEYDKMFEYLRAEMANAENYRTQIHDLKLILKDANKQMSRMADIKKKNQQLEQAIGIKEEEGVKGFVERWIKASDEVNKARHECRRMFEEIESVRRQREIFKLNYQTEVASHVATCYRALRLTATVDEKDVLAALQVAAEGGPLPPGEQDDHEPTEDARMKTVLENQRKELESWLVDYVEEEEEWLEQRQARNAELRVLRDKIDERGRTPALYSVTQATGEVVRIKGDGSLGMPGAGGGGGAAGGRASSTRIPRGATRPGSKGRTSTRTPFDAAGMLYQRSSRPPVNPKGLRGVGLQSPPRNVVKVSTGRASSGGGGTKQQEPAHIAPSFDHRRGILIQPQPAQQQNKNLQQGGSSSSSRPPPPHQHHQHQATDREDLEEQEATRQRAMRSTTGFTKVREKRKRSYLMNEDEDVFIPDHDKKGAQGVNQNRVKKFGVPGDVDPIPGGGRGSPRSRQKEREKVSPRVHYESYETHIPESLYREEYRHPVPEQGFGGEGVRGQAIHMDGFFERRDIHGYRDWYQHSTSPPPRGGHPAPPGGSGSSAFPVKREDWNVNLTMEEMKTMQDEDRLAAGMIQADKNGNLQRRFVAPQLGGGSGARGGNFEGSHQSPNFRDTSSLEPTRRSIVRHAGVFADENPLAQAQGLGIVEQMVLERAPKDALPKDIRNTLTELQKEFPAIKGEPLLGKRKAGSPARSPGGRAGQRAFKKKEDSDEETAALMGYQKPKFAKIGQLDAEGFPVEEALPKPLSRETLNPYKEDDEDRANALTQDVMEEEFKDALDRINEDRRLVKSREKKNEALFANLDKRYEDDKVLRKHYAGVKWKPGG